MMCARAGLQCVPVHAPGIANKPGSCLRGAADPERRPVALETIARGEMTLQGPMILKQGWMGLVPRIPIFVENITDPDERFK